MQKWIDLAKQLVRLDEDLQQMLLSRKNHFTY